MGGLGKYKRYDFRVGIIGCGRLAHYQIKHILQCIKTKNIAICDSDRIRMAGLGLRERVDNLFNSVEELLYGFRPEIVHILTPPRTHYKIAMECLESHCHLFIEKPLCLELKEAEAIYHLAEENGRLVCVDHLFPFDPLLVEAKYDIKAKGLGEVKKILVRDARNYFKKKSSSDASAWLSDLPGELLFDIMPHHLSIVRMFLGEVEVKKVCFDETEAGISKVYCSLNSGNLIGEIHVDINNPDLKFNIAVICENGQIFVDYIQRSKSVRREKNPQKNVPGTIDFEISKYATKTEQILKKLKSFTAQDGYVGMHRLIEKFYRSVQKNLESPVSVDEGLQITNQIGKIFNSVRTKASGLAQITSVAGSNANKKLQKNKTPRILVTGGTGFIGRELVNRLKNLRKEVRILTRCRYNKNHEWKTFWDGVDVILGDISDLSIVEKACDGIDVVYHLAAATKGDWTSHIDSTVKGTENVMKGILSSGCARLVHVSSISVLNQSKYPANALVDDGFPSEEYPERRDAYCFSKLWAEKIIKGYSKQSNKLDIVVLRPGIVYGPGKISIEKLAYRLGKFAVVKGSCGRFLPLVYIENLLDALILAGDAKHSGIFNVVDPEAVTIGRFLRCYRELSGSDFRILCLPFNALLGFQSAVQIIRTILGKQDNYAIYRLKCLKTSARFSTDRLNSKLGWKQKIPFERGIEIALGQGHKGVA